MRRRAPRPRDPYSLLDSQESASRQWCWRNGIRVAFVPDQMVRGFREVSSIARSIAYYYCLHANQTTGECWVAQKTVAEDLDYRLDHVKTYEAELITAGWIEITPDPRLGRIVRIVKGWQSIEERRQKRGATASAPVGDVSPNFGKPASQNLGKRSQNLGKPSQDLGDVSQNLGTHDRKNQSFNQGKNQGNNQPSLSRQKSTEKNSTNGSPPSASPSEGGATDKVVNLDARRQQQLARREEGELFDEKGKHDPITIAFCKAYEAKLGVFYNWQRHDFIQLNLMRRKARTAATPFDLNAANVAQALGNYFGSEAVGVPTLADFAVNFGIFFAGKLDRYKRQEVGAKASKSSGNAYVGAAQPKAPAQLVAVKKTLPTLPEPPEVWSHLLREIQARIPAAQFATWFKPLRFASLTESVLTVRAPSPVFEDWILNNFHDQLQIAISAVGIEAESIIFEAESEFAEG